MKVIKPQRLGLLQRVVQHRRRCTLVVSVLVYVPLDSPRTPLMEMSLWKDLAEVLPGGVLDEGNPKPRGEVLVSGSAYAPGDERVQAVMVRLAVERAGAALVDKKLAAIGDRWWAGSRPTEPVAFRQMPLDWGYSYGGEGFARNPIGKGARSVDSPHGAVVPLPNIEDPNKLVASPKDRPEPAGLGAYELTWPQRFDKIGSDYGPDWLEKLAPGPASDFDAGFYNVAPLDQQIDGFFSGDERFLLEGMHPTRRALEGGLVPLTVRVLVTQRFGEDEEAKERFVAHETRLDTVHFFPDRERAVLVYRATIDVSEDDADDIVHLMVAAEDPAAPRPLEHYQEVLALRLDKERGALASLRDADLMPPVEAGWAVKPDYGDMADMTRLDQRKLEKAERGRKRALAEAKAELIAAGMDPGDAFDEPDPLQAPDPYDIDGIMAFSEEMDRRAADMKAAAEIQRERLEAEARQGFAEAGLDYEAEVQRVADQAGGPIEFSAEEQLLMLHDMARIAAEGGQPLEDLERDLLDPRYEQMLRDLEERAQAAYAQFAHMMPPACVGEERRALLRVRVITAHDVREPMARQNLTGADLSRLDLRGIDLSGALLEGASLVGTDLTDANLSGAVLARADLTDAILDSANLDGCNLGAAVLRRTNLSRATLHQAVLIRAELDGAILHGAQLRGADFIETKFTSADLSHAELTEPLFMKTDLRQVVFTGSSLSTARFIEVDLRGVDMTGASLDKATFVQTQGDDACFAGASLNGAVFVHESSFNRCVFAGARLTSACFRKAPLRGCDFEQADLGGADLSGCDLRAANLHQAKLRGALLVRTDFREANLRGVDLLGAIVHKARLEGADLTGSNLSRADLSLVRADGETSLTDALMLDTRVDPRRRDTKPIAPPGGSS